MNEQQIPYIIELLQNNVMSDVADIIGVGYFQLNYFVKRHKIPYTKNKINGRVSKRVQEVNKQKTKIIYDKPRIIELLKTNNIAEAAEILQIRYANLYAYIRKNNIEYVGIEGNGKNQKSLKSHENDCKLGVGDLEIMYDLYLNGQTLNDIAQLYDVTNVTVSSFFKKYGKKIKYTSGLFEYPEPKLSKDVLIDLYYNQQLSLSIIAKQYSYTNIASVKEEMVMYGIERRDYKQAGAVLFERQPELRQLHRENFYKNLELYGTKPTWIESAFADWAYDNNLEVTPEFQITPITHRYDFHINFTNILVELDGTFWHSSQKAKNRDHMYDTYAAAEGYVVHRFGESDIKKSKSLIFNELLPLIWDELNAN